MDKQAFSALATDWFWYWTSSTLGGATMAWTVGLLYAQGAPESVGSTSSALCVR